MSTTDKIKWIVDKYGGIPADFRDLDSLTTWQRKTEREFSRTYSSGGTIIRRFLNYNAFREALRLHKQGVRPSYAKIGFLYID